MSSSSHPLPRFVLFFQNASRWASTERSHAFRMDRHLRQFKNPWSLSSLLPRGSPFLHHAKQIHRKQKSEASTPRIRNAMPRSPPHEAQTHRPGRRPPHGCQPRSLEPSTGQAAQPRLTKGTDLADT